MKYKYSQEKDIAKLLEDGTRGMGCVLFNLIAWRKANDEVSPQLLDRVLLEDISCQQINTLHYRELTLHVLALYGELPPRYLTREYLKIEKTYRNDSEKRNTLTLSTLGGNLHKIPRNLITTKDILGETSIPFLIEKMMRRGWEEDINYILNPLTPRMCLPYKETLIRVASSYNCKKLEELADKVIHLAKLQNVPSLKVL